MRKKHDVCYSRLLNKNGEYNLSAGNVEDSTWRLDTWNTLVEVKWRWCLLVFALSFVMSWLIFSVIYYYFARSHDSEWEPCLKNINSFASVFLYSLEAQHTIGFGFRYPTEQCSEVILVMGMQAMLGVVIQSLMVGVVFAKMTKPRNRAQTLLFSEYAVIARRDRNLCLSVRVGDMRKYKLANVKIHMMMIYKRAQIDGLKDLPMLAWPVIVYHVIDADSPLYHFKASDLYTARFEIILTLDGLISSTGCSTQASTSYLPSEILWGHRYEFEKLMTYQKKNGLFQLDYSKFHRTYPVLTPNLSAEDFGKYSDSIATKVGNT
ncbi:inward rectifier potassium channel irk 1 [Trichuris trichiura]|uniref:Inward rectifier potassium channel irk 1 n=1 Tax=Trichuris trichiura TaxID=36087 RepID=A0A077Z5K3_TRITR|nr:inward rectifier potassium channel irk 1 [Trichuris trichiura]